MHVPSVSECDDDAARQALLKHGNPTVSIWSACRVFREQIVSWVAQEAGF